MLCILAKVFHVDVSMMSVLTCTPHCLQGLRQEGELPIWRPTRLGHGIGLRRQEVRGLAQRDVARYFFEHGDVPHDRGVGGIVSGLEDAAGQVTGQLWKLVHDRTVVLRQPMQEAFHSQDSIVDGPIR